MRSPSIVLSVVLCILLTPLLLRADEVQKPLKAYNAFRKQKRRLGPEEIKARAEAYLAAWEATGQQATGANRYGLAQWQQDAERYKDAAAGFAAVSQDMNTKPKTRDYAATAEAGVLLVDACRAQMGKEAVAAAVKRLTEYAERMTGDASAVSRGKLRDALGRLFDLGGRHQDAIAMRMKLIAEDPSKLPQLVRPIMYALRDSVHTMAGYETMRKQAAEVTKTLREEQSKKIKEARARLQSMSEKLKAAYPDSVGADGRLKKDNPREMNKAERAVYNAQRQYDANVEVLGTIEHYEKTLAMLGQAAPAVTVENEYGEVTKLADLKGKVVVMDFWLTSGQRSNFGVMRDLMRDFGEKGMIVLGVTATSHVCYEKRYDIDEDYQHKLRPGERKQYAARLATEENPPDEGAAILPEDRYEEIETRVVAAFIKSHELNWPHVMIDDTQPEELYALEGWPHLVVLDREGRIRHIQTVTLTRDKKELVAALRKVIEDLLAET